MWSADPRQMWSFPARFLVEFFDNHGMLGFRDRPQLADGRAAARTATSRRSIAPLARPAAARARRSTRDRAATTTTSLVTPRGGEPERFDEVVLATHSDQALALLADADRPRARAPRRDPLPAQRGGAAHRRARCCRAAARAWASWNYHLLDEPDRPADRDLPHEPPAVAARRARVLRDAEPHRGDRPGQGDPHDPATRTRSSRPTGQAAQARHGEISGRNRTHFCGAYWGWGFHEDGVVSGAARRRALGGAAVTRERASTRARSATAASRSAARVPPPARAGLPRPRRAAGAARRPPRRARARASCASAAATTSATRRVPLADAVRALVAERTGARARRARSACSPTCARSATASTRSASTTASTPTASALEAVVAEVTNTPWGERHAYVLAGGDGRGARRRLRQGAARLAVHGHGPALRRGARRARPRRCRSTSRAAQDGERAFDATLGAATAAQLTAARSRASTARYPAATLRVLALIYGHARRAEAARACPSTRTRRRRHDRRASPAASSLPLLRPDPRRAARRSSRASARHVFGAGAPAGDRRTSARPAAWRAAAARQPRPGRGLRATACGTRPTSPR